MAISITEIVDALQKKILSGKAKTGKSTDKFPSNESISSPLVVFPDNIWKDAASVPASPPASTTSLVTVYSGASRIRMTADPTSAPNETWLATSTYNTPASRLTDFLDTNFGTGYAVRVFIGDPNGGPAARIFPDTVGEEWTFDYVAGVLNFPTAVPGSKTATVGSGTVTVAGNGIYIEVYRYTGEKGVGGGGVQPGDLGTMATQDSDAVDITGGDIANVTFTNVTIDGGTF